MLIDPASPLHRLVCRWLDHVRFESSAVDVKSTVEIVEIDRSVRNLCSSEDLAGHRGAFWHRGGWIDRVLYVAV
ncbi:hypothetical protein RMSM_04727 [Rhodopirellula maiorica SM1]|uniref:Uncharacterized protein n=1 Tax=Rhodopirellula maiorica SM1 TaxID=1265738 RepID=M5RWM5_9BACT|nr:hypothetical protein [Rhodopirellula maiorica]EMI18339.1 hypothetical protein RMSM_04727 [Rhodopirellula maiorica SM1]